MTPREFAAHYLPEPWAERDLQLLVQHRINSWVFFHCRSEVKIPSKATTRRSDLETFWARYELKRELTYDNLKSALGQLYLYNHYGSKILGFIPKRKVIIGLAPSEWNEYQSAAKLAIDIRGMGIKVVFLNEQPNWYSFPLRQLSRWQVQVISVVGIAIAAFTIALVVASVLP